MSRSMQVVHLYMLFVSGWWDIGYSFIVGEDGNVYEGRGWDMVGAHTKGYNSRGLGMGNYLLTTNKRIHSVDYMVTCMDSFTILLE